MLATWLHCKLPLLSGRGGRSEVAVNFRRGEKKEESLPLHVEGISTVAQDRKGNAQAELLTADLPDCRPDAVTARARSGPGVVA